MISVPNVKVLRPLYDSIESNVRALNAVGIESAHVGPLLIPLALEKLPNVIQLQISRRLGKNKWDIEDFLRNINEITARENYHTALCFGTEKSSLVGKNENFVANC